MEFTKEEYEALFRLAIYAWKDIWTADEPLYNEVYKKLEKINKDNWLDKNRFN